MIRLRIAFGFISLVWLIILARVYHLSIKSNSYFEAIAQKNAIKKELIAPVRGQILDIKGKPLAVNRLGFSISIKPHLRGKDEILEPELAAIAAELGDYDIDKLKQEYYKNDSPYSQEFVEVVKFAEYGEIISGLAKLSLRPNISIEPAVKREYPFAETASHIIGYVGRANLQDIQKDPLTKLTNYTGRSGIEAYYNDILQGSVGERKSKITALGKEIEEISYEPAKSSSITLTIDLELQTYLADAFDKESGAVVVMSLKNGAILAAASFPQYDLNPFVSGISKEDWNAIINHPDHPFTNKLINALYPPGSVVKMAMGMAFFAGGAISPNTPILCDPVFELGDRKFRNWRDYGSSYMNITDAIRESCDTYFYRGAIKVGIESIAPVLRQFGFGVKTGIDLPNEYVGIVPDMQNKLKRNNRAWVAGDTVNTSIGQGSFLSTPMQVAKNTALIATGLDISPHLLHSIDYEAQFYKPNEILSQTQKDQLKHIRQGMFEAANAPNGTATRRLSESKVRIAAKTGTAQVVGLSQTDKERIKESEYERYQKSHAWITTYGPYEDPQWVVTVLVEHGSSGGGAAGPVAAKIYNKLLELGYIDKKYMKKSANAK